MKVFFALFYSKFFTSKMFVSETESLSLKRQKIDLRLLYNTFYSTSNLNNTLFYTLTTICSNVEKQTITIWYKRGQYTCFKEFINTTQSGQYILQNHNWNSLINLLSKYVNFVNVLSYWGWLLNNIIFFSTFTQHYKEPLLLSIWK